MLRKIAIYTFAAAALTVFGMGTSYADMYKDTDKGMKHDKPMSSHESSFMGKEKLSVKLGPAPKVSTGAKGESDFTLDKDGKALSYKLEVDDIKDVTQAHIHMVNPDGSAGEVLAPLYPEVGTGALPSGHGKEASREKKEGEFSGTLSKGRITSDQLTGPMKGKTTTELYEMLRTGQAGVNVHTKEHPVGEIWGVSKMASTADKDRK